MKHRVLRWYLAVIFEALVMTAFTGFVHAQFSGGVYTIGSVAAGDDYGTLREAFGDVNGKSVTGPVVFEISQYYTGEGATPATIDIMNITGTSASRTVTVRPAGGINVLTAFNPGDNAPMFRISNCTHITFDGRAGGLGGWMNWIIRNTHAQAACGSVVFMSDDAACDTLRFLGIEGSTAATGLVTIDNRLGSTGCNANVVANCDLGSRNDGVYPSPCFCVYSIGTASVMNADNIVTDCSLRGYFNASPANLISDAGVYLAEGNTRWVLSGNYIMPPQAMTAVSSAPGAYHTGIAIITSGSGFVIAGNHIGGSSFQTAAQARIGPATVPHGFAGIYVAAGWGEPIHIHDNVIANIWFESAWNSSGVPGTFSGICVLSGDAEILSNVVGSDIGMNSIRVVLGNVAGGVAHGIASVSSHATMTVTGNTISGIATAGAAPANGIGITALRVDGASVVTIDSNTVGDPTITKTINTGGSTARSTAQIVRGIVCGDDSLVTISGNVVCNLYNGFNNANLMALRTLGISVHGGIATITNNTVSNLDAYGGIISPSGEFTIAGIALESNLTGQIISGNTVQKLNAGSDGGYQPYVAGIAATATSAGGSTISRNFVHSFGAKSSTVSLTGIHARQDAVTIANNKVRLGINDAGAAACDGAGITGIADACPGSAAIVHNSVFIGGAVAGGATTRATHAFYGQGTGTTRDIRNNIFCNSRSGGVGAYHRALRIDSASLGASGFVLDHNVYRADGASNAMLGAIGVLDIATMPAWRTATGRDTYSSDGDPRYFDPTGPASPITLNIACGNPFDAISSASNGGIPIAGVTVDMDGATRSTQHPDIGAQEFTVLRPITLDGTLPGGRLDDVQVNGAGRTARLGGDLMIDGALSLQNGTLALGPWRLTLNGSMTITGGTLDGCDSARLKIAGEGALPALPALSLRGFELNRATGITLGGDLAVADSLILRAGDVTADPHLVTLGTGAAAPGALVRTGGTMVGPLKRWIPQSAGTDVLFPIGDELHHRPMQVHFTTAPAGGGTITARFVDTTPGNGGLPLAEDGVQIQNVAHDGYWTMTAGDGLAGGMFDLDLFATGFQDIVEVGPLRILTRQPGGSWSLEGSHGTGTGTIAQPEVHRTGLVAMGEFGIGGNANHLLPVEITAFTATRTSPGVRLSWRTATEVNSLGFGVEAASADATELWVERGFVPAAGTSAAPRTYEYHDVAPMSAPRGGEDGRRYRLRMEDRDGSVRHSVVIEVPASPARAVALETPYPNPAGDAITVTWAVPPGTTALLRLVNALGVEVWRDGSVIPGGGAGTTVLSCRGLAAGLYRLELRGAGYCVTRPVVVMRTD